MKEIIAIIRPERAEKTKIALESIGVRGITFVNVTGRGRQGGIIREPDPERTLRRKVGAYILQQRGVISDAGDPKYSIPAEKEIELGFLPKKMLSLVADDDEVSLIVDTLVKVSRNGHQGDGKIFVCPVVDAIRIRTGERGNQALS